MEFPPDALIDYQVKNGDTLSSIAAHYGYITPTQLARLNKLSILCSGLPPIFPGQTLRMPDVSKLSAKRVKPLPFGKRVAPGTAQRVPAQDPSSEERALSCIHEPNFYLPTENVSRRSNTTTLSGYRKLDRSASEMSDQESECGFVKLTSNRVMLDKTLIPGVLLITRENLLFDPSPPTEKAVATRTGSSSEPGVPKSASLNSDLRREATSPTRQGQSKSVEEEPSSSTAPVAQQQQQRELTLCIPLSTLTSLSTFRDLDEYKGVGSSSDGPSPFAEAASSIPQQSSSSSPSISSREPSHELINLPVKSEMLQLSSSYKPDEAGEDDDAVIVLKDRDSPPSPSDSSEHSSSSMGAPPRAEEACTTVPSDIPQSTLPTMPFVYLRLKIDASTEYIFQVSNDIAPKVYSFLLDMRNYSPNNSPYELVAESGTEPEYLEKDDQDMVSKNPAMKRSIVEEALLGLENEAVIPKLFSGNSDIFTEEMLLQLAAKFPSHWVGSNLNLIFNTSIDGFSLNRLYRKSRHVQGGVLLIIHDTMGSTFGALLSEHMHTSLHYYGTGETCVFKWTDKLHCYEWTKKNYFFMCGSVRSFEIGGQSGRNAIWFDAELKYGGSEPTDTFDNPVLSSQLAPFESLMFSPYDQPQTSPSDKSKPSSLHESVPFVIDSLEVWELMN